MSEAVYTVACPRCDAESGAPCLRPDGEERAAHMERFDELDEGWDDFVCPSCGSLDECECDPKEAAGEGREQIEAARILDDELRAANLLRYPDETAKRVICAPCRKGDHVDHHRGVWRKFDNSGPVICPCERCGDVGSQGVLF